MIIEDKGHASIDDPIRRNPVDDLGGAGGGSRGGEGERGRDGQRVYRYEESPKKVLSPISKMSQIDPRMIQSRSEGIRSNDRGQRWKVLRLPRRSEDRMVIRLDPRYESIFGLSLDLVSRRAIPGCARERECHRWAIAQTGHV